MDVFRIENKEVQTKFNKSPGVPIKRDARQHSEQIGRIQLGPAWEDKVWPFVRDEYIWRDKSAANSASIRGPGDVSKYDARMQAW